MTMANLNALERIVAQNILPHQGNYMNMRALKTAQKELDLTDEEVKKYVIPPSATAEDGPQGKQQINFTKEGTETTKEIELGEIAYGLLKIALKQLNEAQTLKPEHMTLYAKIIEDEKPK